MSGLNSTVVAWLDRKLYPGVPDQWDGHDFRARVLEVLTDQSVVLDIGAGPGSSEVLDFRGKAKAICGVDPDARVLEMRRAGVDTFRTTYRANTERRLRRLAMDAGLSVEWISFLERRPQVPFVDVVPFRRWLPLAVQALPLDRQRPLDAGAPTFGARPKSGFGGPAQKWLQAEEGGRESEPGLRPCTRAVGQWSTPTVRTFRVAVLLTDAYGGIGGIAKFNRDLLAALAAIPECREVIAFPRLVQREPEPIPAKVRYELAAARGKRAYIARTLRFAVDHSRSDLIICGHLNLLPLAWLVSALKGCRLMLIVHGIEAWKPHRSALVRRLLDRADAIVSVSRYTVARMRSWSGLPQDRFRILPNCVDLSTYRPRPRNEALARRLTLDGRRVLLTLGRLAEAERYKGFDEVLEVLPDLARGMPDLVYVIAGDGDDRGRLEQKARELGMAERVVFTGYVSEEEKLDLYALTDAYVMPSRGEGFGIVFLEAMASGVPVIGSTADGSREALMDGKLGLFVDPGDRSALIQAIREALARPRGRPRGLEYFDVSAYRHRLAALVREVVSEAGLR